MMASACKGIGRTANLIARDPTWSAVGPLQMLVFWKKEAMPYQFGVVAVVFRLWTCSCMVAAQSTSASIADALVGTEEMD